MSRSLVYRVHSVSTEKVPVETTYRDKPMKALVDGLTVELVGDGHDHGHTFRFVPDGEEDMAFHREMFATGRTVRITFEAEGDAPPAQQHDGEQQPQGEHTEP